MKRSLRSAKPDFTQDWSTLSKMLVTKAQQNAFGTPVQAEITKMLSAGIGNPPKDRSGNTDYVARDIACRLSEEIRKSL